jgi:DNA-binding response OmpR family regulator
MNTNRTLMLFHWNPAGIEARAATLRADGWEVATEAEDGARGVRRLLNAPPTLVVLDLSRRPAQSFAVASAIRRYRDIRHLPLMFVGGTKEHAARIQEEFPGAACIPAEMLLTRLRGFDG